MGVLWHIRLMGGLTATGVGRTIIRYQSRKTGAALAYLAFKRGPVAREELIEQVWPDQETERGRHNLRQSLSTLRKQLEPPDVPHGSVLYADHANVLLCPAAVGTDVARFQAAIRSASNWQHGPERIDALVQAEGLYGGELLPGHFDDWVLAAREKLSATYIRLLQVLVSDLEMAGNPTLAVEYALQATQAAFAEESLHHAVVRLYLQLGRECEALRHFRQFEQYLRREENRTPGRVLTELVSPILSFNLSAGGAFHALPQRTSEPARIDVPIVRLPVRLTRFFGRADEISRLEALLSPHAPRRLVTLLGPGGSGKTRLAIEAAARLMLPYNNAVTFISAEHIARADHLLLALANAVAPDDAAGEPRARLAVALSAATHLLVLDNCEQFTEEVGGIVEEVLRLAPGVHCLATSRCPLHIEGETLFPVTPLPVPTRPGTPHELLEYASVQIFVDRAQTANPDFQITVRNAAAIAAVCERLEGIPLAIELAAARAQSLTPAQMNVQLDMRLDFLVSRRRSVENRHRTLRAAIDWSFRPLHPELQRLFARLSVFRGSFSVAAAAAIDSAGADTAWMLAELVSHCLVIAEERDNEIRFRLLESIRAYAAEQVEEAEKEMLFEHFTSYFVQQAEEAAGYLRTPERAAWTARLDADADNLLHALETNLDNAVGLRLCGALWRYWLVRGQAIGGVRYLHIALAVGNNNEMVRAQALLGLGALSERLGRLAEAYEAHQESLALFSRQGERSGSAQALNALTVLAERQGDYEYGCIVAQQALELWKALGDMHGMAGTLNNLGRLETNRNELMAAECSYRASLKYYQELRDWANTAIVLLNLGATLYRRGSLSEAQAAYCESVDLFRALNNQAWLAVALHNLGDTLCRQNQPSAAKPMMHEALGILRELDDRVGVAVSIESLATVARLEGQYSRAARLLGSAELLRESIGTPLSPVGNELLSSELAALHCGMSEHAFVVEWSRGRCMGYEQCVAYALDIPDIPGNAQEPLEGDVNGTNRPAAWN